MNKLNFSSSDFPDILPARLFYLSIGLFYLVLNCFFIVRYFYSGFNFS